MDATNRKKADPTRIGDKWARREDIKWFQYWCQFLQVSPSYELARKCRAGELTIGEPVPADFDAVLAVYDNLGSVIVPSFVDWWREIGITHFGYVGEKPKPALLGAIQHNRADDPSERLTGAVESYVSGTWHQQGEPAAIIAAIPVGLPKAQIVKWVDAMLAEHGAQQPEKPSEPTYKLYGKKLHFLSVYQYLRVTQAKAANPDMTLWQLGAKAKLSSLYDGLLKKSEDGKGTAEERHALKILTSRALNRGHMIAENAARGIFPSYAKCPHAMSMDWGAVQDRLISLRGLRRS